MNRPVGVVVAAVLMLVGSVLDLGMGALTWFSFRMMQSLPEGQAQPGALPGFLIATTLTIFFGSAAWGLATGIGLLLMKRWARISAIVIASFLALFGALCLPLVLVVPMPQLPGAESYLLFVRVVVGVFYVLLLAIGVWWLVYFNRRKVREAFAGGMPVEEPASQRPLSIAIIAWILVSSAPLMPFLVLLKFPAPLMGFTLTGRAALLTYLAFGVAGTLAGYWLLKMKPQGHTLTVGYFLFGLINGMVNCAVPGTLERMKQMFLESLSMQLPREAMPPEPPIWVSIFISVLCMAVPLYFLFTRKKSYFAACEAAAKPR